MHGMTMLLGSIFVLSVAALYKHKGKDWYTELFVKADDENQKKNI